jgi:ornithine cyclodeaminase/alanine dehydrogenase-like protein (mu-crystallin family)
MPELEPGREILVLSEADVQQTLTMSEAVELARAGLQADAADEVMGDKYYMDLRQEHFVKPFSGYKAGADFFFVKTFNFFADNAHKGLPVTSSQVLLFEAETGMPVCLMEAGWLTALKTGASTALTVERLCQNGATTAAIFGAGLQGQMHLQALSVVRDWAHVWLVDVDPLKAERVAGEMMAELGLRVEAASSPEAAVRASDVVITVTTGDGEFVKHNWLKRGALVCKMGSYQELDLNVISQADKLVVDSWEYVSHRNPELQRLLGEGRLNRQALHAEWPDILAGRVSGRENDAERIVYIALGIWGEYATLLPGVYGRARKNGLGQVIDLLGTRTPHPQKRSDSQ